MVGVKHGADWQPTAAHLRARLAANLPCIGAWQMMPGGLITDTIAPLGFHWLAVDLEHSRLSPLDAEEIFIAAERHGCVPLARLPAPDDVLARRLLDGGCQGFIIATVEDERTFDTFAKRCSYPPRGTRGVGLTRSNLWGKTLDETLTSFRPILVPQIESVAGVNALRRVAALESVDAVFIGPYDLSASLGVPGDLTAPEMQAAIAEIKSACLDAGKPRGTHQVTPELDQLEATIGEGFTFVAYGADTVCLRYVLDGLDKFN